MQHDCYMLIETPDCARYGIVFNLQSKCCDHCRAEVPVEIGTSFDDLRQMLVQCESCDGLIPKDGRSVAFTTYYHRYTDPRTGQGGYRPNKVGQPGAMWYGHWIGKDDKFFIAEEYHRDWAGKRPPLFVLLPDGTEFCVDQRATDGRGWTVTGEAPLITVHPSIDTQTWHGWLQNGVLRKC